MRRLLVAVSLLSAGVLHAQQLDFFDPDDFVHPDIVGGRMVFVSRIVTGAARGYMDQYRRVGQDIGFVHVSNSLYWGGFQLDYKRCEIRGENGRVDGDPDPDQNRIGTLQHFENGDRTPAPEPGPKNVTQLSWYQTFGDRLIMRYRLVHATQYAPPETFASVSGLDDSDETRMAQVDAGITHGHRTQFATVVYTELTRHSTFDRTRQRTLTIAAYLPVLRLGPSTITPRLMVGGVAGEGPVIDIVNPSLDWSVIVPRTDAAVHLVYSPVYRELDGGNVHHQVVLYADRALLVLVLGGLKRQAD